MRRLRQPRVAGSDAGGHLEYRGRARSKVQSVREGRPMWPVAQPHTRVINRKWVPGTIGVVFRKTDGVRGAIRNGLRIGSTRDEHTAIGGVAASDDPALARGLLAGWIDRAQIVPDWA